VRVGGTGHPSTDRAVLDRGLGGDLPDAGRCQAAGALLSLPYFPITPLFPLAGPAGLVPLPSKWHISFGEPIYTADYNPADA
jgi:hypothetical protein